MKRKRLRQHNPLVNPYQWYASARDYEFILKILDNPPEPTEKLKALWASYEVSELRKIIMDSE